jgi:glycosyltransferase involved in cell wall biosynthesis
LQPARSNVHQAKPHVIMIAYHFPPAPEIGGLRPFRFRKYLERLGYRCHVITASAQDESSDGDIIFIRDELQAVWDEGPGGRLSFEGWQELLIRQLMFPGHVGFIWSRKAAARCHEIICQLPRDKVVLYSTYPPMGTLTAGLLVRLREHIPWIADFRDPIGGVAAQLVSLRARFWNRRLEGFTFRSADAVVANVEAAAEMWRQRYSWAARKLHVIYNGFDPENSPQPRAIPPRSQKLIVHAGTLYHGRNPNIVVESLARLRTSGAPEAGSAKILLLGDFDAKAGIDQALFDRAMREGWLELQPIVPRAASQQMMEEADGLLLVQPQSHVQVPGKLFEYISIGRPILALVPRSSAVEQILQQSGAPQVCVYPDEPREEVDGKILAFLRMPNTPVAANEWFAANFNAERQAEQLAAVIDAIL